MKDGDGRMEKCLWENNTLEYIEIVGIFKFYQINIRNKNGNNDRCLEFSLGFFLAALPHFLLKNLQEN